MTDQWKCALDPARPSWPGVLMVPADGSALISVEAGRPHINFAESKALAESIIAALSAHAADAARLQQQEQEIADQQAVIRGLRFSIDLSAHYHDLVPAEFDLPDPSTNAIVDRLRAELARAEKAEADNAALRAQVETLTDEKIAEFQRYDIAAAERDRAETLLEEARGDLSTLRDQLAQQGQEKERLRQFALDVLRGYDDGDIGDIDGGQLQELAVKSGVLDEVQVSAPCCEACVCAEVDHFPTTCYRLSPLVLPAPPVLASPDTETK